MGYESRNGNGQKPALAFRAQPGSQIPIVGQRFSIGGWFPTVLIKCHCGAHESVMVPSGGASACPSCQTVFSVQSVRGDVNFGIGVQAPDGQAPSAGQGDSHD